MGARARLFVLSFVGMACVWLGGATGCGSVIYVNQVTRKASTSVEAAKAAEADVYAPYHYTLAVHYLRKAREEAAAADFQAANRFGRMSYQAAETARELAVERAANPGDRSWKPPPGAPAYDGTAPAPAGDGGEPGGEAGEASSEPGSEAGEASSEDGEEAAQPGDAGDGDAAGEQAPAAPETDTAKPGAKPEAKQEAKPGAMINASTGAKEDGR